MLLPAEVLYDDWYKHVPAGALAIGFVAVWLLSLIAYWRIASKAGYPGCYGCLVIIPFVGFVALMYFAFSAWPIQSNASKGKATRKKRRRR